MDSQAAAIDKEGMARGWIQLPERRFNPVRQILRRILYVLIVLTAVAILVMVARATRTHERTKWWHQHASR